MTLIELIVEKAADILFDKGTEAKKQSDLKQKLSDYLERQQVLFDQSEYDFNFEALLERIENAMNKTALHNLTAVDPETRARAKESIRKSCVRAAFGNDNPQDQEAREKVEEIINQYLANIICDYDERNPVEYHVLGGEVVDAVNAHSDANKNELKQDLISEIQKMLGQPPEHGAAQSRQPTSAEKTEQTHDETQKYQKQFYKPLFLEEEDDSPVTLASMYVSPHIEGEKSAADCIMKWFGSETRKTCFLLFGNAGVGKSSLISKIVADAHTDGQKDFRLNSDQVLAIALRNHCDEIDLTKDAPEILMNLFQGFSLEELESKLLILDGLDEVCVLRTVDRKFDGHTFLEKMTELDSGFHVLVTSRDAKDYFDDPDDIEDLEQAHLEWTIAEVEAWCENYCKAKQEKQAWCDQFIKDYKALLKKDKKKEEDHRAEALCVPMILYICGHSDTKMSDHSSIGSIYSEAFRKILQRSHLRGQSGRTRFKDTDLRSNRIAWQYTKEIAYQMFLLKTLNLAESDDPDNPYADGLRCAKDRTKMVCKEKYGYDVPDDALEVKKELALCPFTKANGQGGITFAHKTVYEYFTAVKLYEDYFAKIDFTKPLSEVGKNVMTAAIGAFRYRSIENDIFAYLCTLTEAPFSEKDGGLDVDRLKKAFVQAMEDHVLNTIAVEAPLPEYFKPHMMRYRFDPVNTQIVRAFRALICYLTGLGFRNETGAEACKQIGAMLVRSDQEINMQGWDLTGADLSGADLIGANLSGADLRGADLGGADLRVADLRGADLGGAYLRGAHLRGAHLRGAHLRYAFLIDAHLTGADLTGANLRSANLSGADLRGADLSAMFYDNNTRWENAKYCKNSLAFTQYRDDFHPEEHGMIEVDYRGTPVQK